MPERCLYLISNYEFLNIGWCTMLLYTQGPFRVLGLRVIRNSGLRTSEFWQPRSRWESYWYWEKGRLSHPGGKKKNWIGELPTFHSAASGRGVLSKVLPSWIMTEKLPLLSDYCTFRQKSMGWCPRHLSGTWLSHTFRATSTQRERQWKGGAVTLRVSSVSKVRPNPTPPTFFAAGSSGHFGSRLPLFTCWARLSTRKR